MALPARLLLPDFDPAETPEHLNANQALLERGAGEANDGGVGGGGGGGGGGGERSKSPPYLQPAM